MDFLKGLIDFCDGNKIAIYCGITAIIASYIIFIAEIISSKEQNKTYRRIILQDSWMFKQLLFIIIVFILLWGASYISYVVKVIILILIIVEIVIFFWRFMIVLGILKSSKFYKKRRMGYIKKTMNTFIKYNINIKKKIDKNQHLLAEQTLSNVCYDKYCFDYNEEYEKILADRSGVIKGINKINLKEIDNILKNNVAGTNKTNEQSTNTSNIIICYVDGEYVKKGYPIAYIPKKYNYLIEKFNKIDIKPERNNDEIITDIFRDYLDVFVKNSDNSSSYLNQESYFDFYEFSCLILDSDNEELVLLLQDSIDKMRFNIDRKNKTAISNVISICKNLLIFDNKKEKKHFDFEKYMLNIITYDSFILLDLCSSEDSRKEEVKFFVQNVAEFVNYEFKNEKGNIKNYFYTSISEYVKLIACSPYNEKKELINIVVNNIRFDKSAYDIFTVIYNKQLIKKLRSSKKINMLKQNNIKLKYNIDLVNSYILTTLLGILYGDFEKDDEYINLLKRIVDSVSYGYDLEEVLLTYLNLNESSNDIISKWGIIENPYDIVSDYKTIDLKEALLLFLYIAEIHNFELSEEFIDIKYKYFFNDLIKQLKEYTENKNNTNYRKVSNDSSDKIITELKYIYDLIIKKEKNDIIKAKLNDDNIMKFKSIVSSQTDKDHPLYNYYINKKLIINRRKRNEKYNGYSNVVDKEIMLSFDNFVSRMAEDYRDGLMNYKEKIIIEAISDCSTEIEAKDIETGIEKAIDKLIEDKVNPNDILIIADYIYSIKLHKNNKHYKYNGIKYKIINKVSTKNRVYIINTQCIPKLIFYKFTDDDLKILNATKNDLKNNDRLLIKVSDLSCDKEERERILKEDLEWLNKEESKDEYIKSKVLIKILQKVDIQPNETNIGYYFNE